LKLDYQIFDVIWLRDLFLSVKLAKSFIFKLIYFLDLKLYFKNKHLPTLITHLKSSVYARAEYNFLNSTIKFFINP